MEFGGIIAINISSAGIHFSTGDILIIMASVCTVASSILGKKIVAKNSPFWITGISQFMGGMILVLSACIFGAILLEEDIFKIQYLEAFLLIFWGIMIGNKSQKG